MTNVRGETSTTKERERKRKKEKEEGIRKEKSVTAVRIDAKREE
jgi:hypothetical protein